MGFSFVENIKDYSIKVTDRCKTVMLAGVAVVALSVGSVSAGANEDFRYDIPTDNYDLVVNNNTADESTILSNFLTVVGVVDSLADSFSLNIKGGDEMSETEAIAAEEMAMQLSPLPILKSFAQYNPCDGSLYVSMAFPHSLMISMTRYLRDGDDKDVYFSVKGEGELLYTGAMPVDELVKRTFKSLASIDEMA